MATYTAVADANGDFTVPFSSNYTAGQKVIVTAEKSGATKTIELFAPSDPYGGGVIQFGGSLANFPNGITSVTINLPSIANNAFNTGANTQIFLKATSLILLSATSIGDYAFSGWSNAVNLTLPEGLLTIGQRAFSGWAKLNGVVIPNSVATIGAYAFDSNAYMLNITIGDGVTQINGQAFAYLTRMQNLYIKPPTPPTLLDDAFASIRSACVFHVPAASLAAYQAAPFWSKYASKMVGDL
ncbi:leucine-rich repeat domain-containing protein [Acinetobacter sp. YH16038]|uniref:leucine-rich repeat domain-containing protein n=1 Tax=Acinetobacter sp. YH16038 TaxID=2601183 RepID=UPI0015D317E1|nr:leucine-rich repeat domain-containing protein [Acinetobacter sp. YH16038]